MSVVVLLTFILFYNKIFAVTFDENFIKAAGVKANAYTRRTMRSIASFSMLKWKWISHYHGKKEREQL